MEPLLVAFALVLGAGQSQVPEYLSFDEPVVVEYVDVRGYRAMPRETILYNIQTLPGTVLDREVVRRDIQTLYNIGNFEDIRVEAEPGETEGSIVLVFQVAEKPRVGDITYIGLKSVSESDLLDRFQELGITVQRELPYDESMVQRARGVIREMLAVVGRQNASVDVETYALTQSRVGVEFLVDEGPKIKIEEIEIVGNEVFTDARLKAAMEYTKETGPVVSFKNLDLYHEEKLRYDMGNNLLGLYRANGYVRASILEPEVEVRTHRIARTLPLIRPSFPWGIPLPFWKREVDRYFITIRIEENEQYRVGEVQVTGNVTLTDDQIRAVVGLVPGDVYDETAMRGGFDALIELYGQRGYINFSPVPSLDYDDENRLVNVVLNIEEDRQFYVREINFRGNTTTRDNVIRREFLLNEGAPFNSQALELSILRVNQLDYFEPIGEDDYDIQASVSDPPEVEVTVNLTERGRNTLGFTGGVSGIGGSFLGVNYETNNFLGMGETLAVSAQGGTRQSNYMFSLTEPYLFGRPILTGFSLFSTEYRFDQARDVFGLNPDDLADGVFENRLNFEQSRKGFSVFTSYPLALFQRLGVNFQFANSSTSAINEATASYFEGVRQFDNQDFGTEASFSDFRTRSIMPNYVWNTVNNPSFPTAGQSLSISAQFTGGFLGGNVNYYRPVFEYRAFKPMNGRRNTLAFRLQASHISGFSGTSAPFYERFRLGGDFDVRGFDFQSLLPLAWVESVIDLGGGITAVRDRLAWIGGDTMAVANLEYRIPLGGYMFTLAPFLDVGNSWAVRREQLRREIVLSDGTVRSEGVKFVHGTNSGVRASTGIELQVMMPVINAPFRVMYYYNPLRMDETVTGPITGSQILLRQEEKGFKFTVGRTF